MKFAPLAPLWQFTLSCSLAGHFYLTKLLLAMLSTAPEDTTSRSDAVGPNVDKEVRTADLYSQIRPAESFTLPTDIKIRIYGAHLNGIIFGQQHRCDMSGSPQFRS